MNRIFKTFIQKTYTTPLLASMHKVYRKPQPVIQPRKVIVPNQQYWREYAEHLENEQRLFFKY